MGVSDRRPLASASFQNTLLPQIPIFRAIWRILLYRLTNSGQDPKKFQVLSLSLQELYKQPRPPPSIDYFYLTIYHFH